MAWLGSELGALGECRIGLPALASLETTRGGPHVREDGFRHDDQAGEAPRCSIGLRTFELDYEDVEFETRDGVTLRGWLIKGGTDKVIIQTHFGVQCSRSGYTPKGKGMIKMWKEDISFLRQAKYLNERGYTVLMYDMRNHGESDLGDPLGSPGDRNEAEDVIAAVDFISIILSIRTPVSGCSVSAWAASPARTRTGWAMKACGNIPTSRP